MVYALSLGLFGRPLTLSDFPENREIVGKGMSDWDGYAKSLAKKLNYTNTFYHKIPRLDITKISTSDVDSLDFLLSTDVFEHVSPPVMIAFKNASRMLRDDGVFVFSVPYTLESDTVEHFPNLNDYVIEHIDGVRTLINKTKDGLTEIYKNLTFHGGEGDTLEMRVFSESGLLRDLKAAGFIDVTILKEPYFNFGIYQRNAWSLPIIAKKSRPLAKIEDWGPRSLNGIINFGGNKPIAAIWIKLHYLRPGSNIEVIMGKAPLESLVVDGNVITGYIPRNAMESRGPIEIVIKDRLTNLEMVIGSILLQS
jgi:SAM-dependent methyltransferase